MKKRAIIVDGSVARVPLTRGLVAILDAEDAHHAEGFNWTALSEGHTHYARRNDTRGGGQRSVLLHRIVMGAKPGQVVDHINGDGLDCRKSNMRLASQRENCCNSRPRKSASGIKGVHKHRLCNKFVASIAANGRRHYLGLFYTAEQAAQAYAQASARLHGEFGRTA